MPGHVIMLHGYDNDGNDMASHETAVRQLLSADTLGPWRFWRPNYDFTRPFPDAAGDLLARLREQEQLGVDFTNTILIGYSMGGVVARSLVAQGFPCRNLLTISSPHGGHPLAWAANLILQFGAASLQEGSQELTALNGHPLDLAARSRYEFYGVTYVDANGNNVEDDGLFSLSSQIGESIPGPNAFSRQIRMTPSTPVIDANAQIHGGMVMDVAEIGPFIGQIANLIARYQGVKITWVEHDGTVPQTEADEYVEITNFEDVPQDISNWVLCDHDEGTEFRFPPGSSVPARASIRVYTNEARPEWGGYSFGSDRAIWNNQDPDRAVLKDPTGGGIVSRIARYALWGTKG